MGTMTDSLGNYFIGNLSPGMYRIQVSSVGYKTYVSPEFRISSYDYTLDIGVGRIAGGFKRGKCCGRSV